jgi:phosphopantothenoylcysteine decarboxylase/phosphopantothenate--cysteine ligase
MRCVVTAGPTYEPLDDVRRLTNFSTGRLGTELGKWLGKRGHEVTLLLGEQATYQGERHELRVERFTTTADLGARLQRLGSEGADAVFHAAAVSDFAFGTVWRRSAAGELEEVRAGKLTTREGNLLAELVPMPKLIGRMRECFPAARLVGWKYEVDGDRASVVQAALRQMAECRTNACVVNGPAYGAGFGLVREKGGHEELAGQEELFQALAGLVEG